MRNFFLLLTVLKLGFNSFTIAQSSKSITIKGELKGLKDTQLYLSFINDGMLDTVSIADSKNGQFSFKIKSPKPATFYFVQIDTSVTMIAKSLLVEDKNMTISGDIRQWPNELDIQGSLSNSEQEDFGKKDYNAKNQESKVWEEIAKYKVKSATSDKSDSVLQYAIKLKIDTLEQKLKIIQSERFTIWNDYILRNLNSMYVPLLIQRLEPIIGLDSMQILYNKLSNKAQQSIQGIALNKRIRLLKNSKNVEIGKIAPNFQVEILNKGTTNLYAIIENSKYTLIDFWASWCAPCRANFVHFKKVYEKYSPKGLSILSISTDKDRKSWINAVQKDSLPWLNGVENYNSQHPLISTSYGVDMLPFVFLLDNKGKIVGDNDNLVGRNLDLTLKSLFD